MIAFTVSGSSLADRGQQQRGHGRGQAAGVALVAMLRPCRPDRTAQTSPCNRAGRAVRLCPHCRSRRAHCRTHGRAGSWLRVLPAPPAAPAVAGVPRHRDVPAQPRTAAAVKHLRGRAVPSRALASPSRGADRPVILGGAANSGHTRRTPSASGCGRAASGARTYRFGLNLSAAPPPSRRGDVLELRRLNDDSWTTNRGPEHRSCYTGPGSTGLVVGSVDHAAQTVVGGTPASTRKGRAEHRCGQDRVFLWPIRAVPSAIHSASSTALAPSALAESPPVASSNWCTTSAASRPRSLTLRPCARAQFRTASLCASEPLLLTPPPERTRLGARRRLAVALFAPPVRPRVPCPGPRAARCGRSPVSYTH